MTRVNVRCSRETCKLRYVFDRHPDDYQTPRKCGLHVHWNMQVIHWRENAVKSWHTWPGMPFEQLELV